MTADDEQNIKPEMLFGEGGKETRIGTKQFKGGAKVLIIGSYSGMCERLILIGQKFIRSVARVTAVENLRVKQLYGKSPLRLRLLEAPQRRRSMLSF